MGTKREAAAKAENRHCTLKKYIQMAFNKQMLFCTLAAVCLAGSIAFASAEDDFMQFAYIRDATVGPESVYEIMDTSICGDVMAQDAMVNKACHADAQRICAMMDDCGGFVIEPKELSDLSVPGVLIKVFTEKPTIYAMTGATVFEFRGMVSANADGVDDVDKFLDEQIDHEQMAADIDDVLSKNDSVTSIELAIKAFLEAMEVTEEMEKEMAAKVEMLAEIKRKEIQKIADTTMEKAGSHNSRGLPTLRPKVTCTRGKLVSPKTIAPAVYTPKRKPVLDLGDCTKGRKEPRNSRAVALNAHSHRNHASQLSSHLVRKAHSRHQNSNTCATALA